jgi:hypothetical protein
MCTYNAYGPASNNYSETAKKMGPFYHRRSLLYVGHAGRVSLSPEGCIWMRTGVEQIGRSRFWGRPAWMNEDESVGSQLWYKFTI